MDCQDENEPLLKAALLCILENQEMEEKSKLKRCG